MVHALRGLSFSVHEGEMVVILGPSGSGKSTLLNLLGGIDFLSEGSLLYRGRELSGLSPEELGDFRREEVGFVFQFYNLLPNLTALENIELAGELTDNPLPGEELIRQIGLWERRNNFPGKLSGGEQQRIAIARALCKNPRLLLCDEPTGALDSSTGVQVLELLSDFHKKYNKTVLIITHNESITGMADRVFYIKDGALSKIRKNPRPISPSEVSW